MVDVNKLKGKIVEKALSVEKVAVAIGIDKTTMYRKINNSGESFTIGEADRIAKLLDLTAFEAQSIFFAQYVA